MTVKKLISLLACLAIIVTLCPQTIAINETFKSMIMDYDPVEDDTPNDEVEYIDSFVLTNTNTTYSTRTAHRINTTVEPNKTKRTTDSYYLEINDIIVFDFTYTPALDSTKFRIGIYEVNRKKTTYMVFSGGKLKGNYTITTAGEYKIEFKNISTQSVTVTGTFTPAKFTDIGVPLCGQEDSNLCWAACSEMISEYYNYSATQEAIVKYVKNTDKMVNEKGSSGDIKEAIEYATNSTHTCTGYYATASNISEISNEINNNRPVIMLFTNGSGNHVCVATAVDDQDLFVRYNNPMPLNTGKVYTKRYNTLISSESNKYNKYMTVS